MGSKDASVIDDATYVADSFSFLCISMQIYLPQKHTENLIISVFVILGSHHRNL